MMKKIEEEKIKYLLEYDNGRLMMLLGEQVDTTEGREHFYIEVMEIRSRYLKSYDLNLNQQNLLIK